MVILSGPASAEDRIYYDRTTASGRSSADIAAELERLGASAVTMIDITENQRWYDKVDAHDLVIINLHGSPGEDGTIQGLLRSRSIRFLGSDVEASVLALNKYLTKLVARDIDVPTPRLPPRVPGTTRGCRSARSGTADLETGARRQFARHVRLAARSAAARPQDWLVEEFLEGVDVTVAVIEVAGVAAALRPWP